MSPAELLMQTEYAEFLRRTNLDRLRPDHDIRPTKLGRYDELWDQILVHQVWLSEREGQPVPLDEAVTHWYDHVYLPVVRVIREQGVLKRFPSRSEADVYLWVMAHREELEHRYGHEVAPAASATDYANLLAQETRLARRLQRTARTTGRRIRRAVRRPQTRDGP
jgi:hypothetical protein